jgi:SAM-dependent methyltransferase
MRGIRSRVRAHYSAAIARFGPTPLGVDWQNMAAQQLRFVQLVKICDFAAPFSLNDFGCGYGALLDYLKLRHPGARVTYHGIDLVPAMIGAAERRWATRPRTSFAVSARCDQIADYALASGVFNVRLGEPVVAWESYVKSILADLGAHSRIGFAVNFMLRHDDKRTERELYRTSPERWVSFCQRQLGCSVDVIADYGLREFTLLARSQRTTR